MIMGMVRRNCWIQSQSSAFIMEYTGFEPVASTMRMLRAPNCANNSRALRSGSRSFGFPYGNNGARTHDLPLVRRALSPAELCFHITKKTLRHQPFRSDAANGAGGNRTRVQKPIPCTSTIIVRSFSFPLLHGNEHPYRFSSFILRLTAQSFADIVSHIFDTGFPMCECIRSGMQHLGCS